MKVQNKKKFLKQTGLKRKRPKVSYFQWSKNFLSKTCSCAADHSSYLYRVESLESKIKMVDVCCCKEEGLQGQAEIKNGTSITIPAHYRLLHRTINYRIGIALNGVLLKVFNFINKVTNFNLIWCLTQKKTENIKICIFFFKLIIKYCSRLLYPTINYISTHRPPETNLSVHHYAIQQQFTFCQFTLKFCFWLFLLYCYIVKELKFTCDVVKRVYIHQFLSLIHI